MFTFPQGFMAESKPLEIQYIGTLSSTTGSTSLAYNFTTADSGLLVAAFTSRDDGGAKYITGMKIGGESVIMYSNNTSAEYVTSAIGCKKINAGNVAVNITLSRNSSSYETSACHAWLIKNNKYDYPYSNYRLYGSTSVHSIPLTMPKNSAAIYAYQNQDNYSSSVTYSSANKRYDTVLNYRKCSSGDKFTDVSLGSYTETITKTSTNNGLVIGASFI